MKTKRTFITITTVCLIIMACVLSLPITAAGESSAVSDIHEQIDRVVSNEISKASIPNAAIAIIRGDEVEYLSYSNSDGEPAVDKHTLFQIGSVSKAYTGLGVLLLEDEGLLSLDDPISKYLPWFTVSYDGKTVPADDLTVANALYQTSGFTNSEGRYPTASYGMSIEENLRQISGSELVFYPSSQYAYANTNYRILGLIIEVVSGQSYDSFMTEHILLPLGLNNTYTSPQNALDTGNTTGGNRISFFRTWAYDHPAAVGNVPQGYIYSNTQDMSRWLQIQMGIIEVPEQFQRIIEKSHQPNPGSVINDSTRYASGWFVDEKTGEINHSGGTPNYSSYVAICPQSNIAVCVLSDISATSNTNRIANNILNILQGKSTEAYRADVWVAFDKVFSVVTILCIIGVVLCVFFAVRIKRQIRDGRREKIKLTRKSLPHFVFPSILTLCVISFVIIFSIIFENSWDIPMVWTTLVPVWAPPSLISGAVSLVVLSVCMYYTSFFAATSKKL